MPPRPKKGVFRNLLFTTSSVRARVDESHLKLVYCMSRQKDKWILLLALEKYYVANYIIMCETCAISRIKKFRVILQSGDLCFFIGSAGDTEYQFYSRNNY
jgi:hypothetical protein